MAERSPDSSSEDDKKKDVKEERSAVTNAHEFEHVHPLCNPFGQFKGCSPGHITGGWVFEDPEENRRDLMKEAATLVTRIEKLGSYKPVREFTSPNDESLRRRYLPGLDRPCPRPIYLTDLECMVKNHFFIVEKKEKDDDSKKKENDDDSEKKEKDDSKEKDDDRDDEI